MSIINDALKKVQNSRHKGFWRSKSKDDDGKEKNSTIHQTIKTSNNEETITTPLPEKPRISESTQRAENQSPEIFPTLPQTKVSSNPRTWLKVLEFGLIGICLITTIFLLGLNFQMVKSAKIPVVPEQTGDTPVPVVETGINLKGVMMMPEGNIALINDKTYKVGDTVKGMKIKEITINQVVFDNWGKTKILQVEE